jgi:VanZ family protein
MFRKPFLPGGLWTLLIALLTLLPGDYIPRTINFPDWLSADKILHLLLFGVYLFLLPEGFRKQVWFAKLRRKPVITSLVIGIVFAFFIEVMQMHVIPGRNGNIYDFLADIAGSLLGVTCWHIIRRNEKKKLYPSEKNN